MLNIATAGPRGGTLSILDGGGGGPTELHITNPRKYRAWNLTPKKISGMKISYPKKILIYSIKQRKKSLWNLSTQKNTWRISRPKKIPRVQMFNPKKNTSDPPSCKFRVPPLGRRQSSVALECPRKWSFPREARSSKANSLEENTMTAFRRPRFGNVKYYMAVRNDRIRF